MIQNSGGQVERLFKRLLQRLLVIGLGVVSIWLIVFVVFRFADHRLPWVLALGVTYGLAAYVILPRAVHMELKILQRRHVPRFTVTGDGLPGDPVNLVLVGTLHELRSAFATVGWSEADRLGMASSWRMIEAFVFNRPYPTARSAPSIFLAAARTSAFRRRSMTVRASAITSDFGRWPSPMPNRPWEPPHSG